MPRRRRAPEPRDQTTLGAVDLGPDPGCADPGTGRCTRSNTKTATMPITTTLAAGTHTVGGEEAQRTADHHRRSNDLLPPQVPNGFPQVGSPTSVTFRQANDCS